MWLPSPIYERIPQFWLLMGLMFFAFGLYLGFDYQLIFAYLALGVMCVGRSLWIFQARRLFRTKAFDAEVAQQAAEAAQQAAEATKDNAEAEQEESAEHHAGAPSY